MRKAVFPKWRWTSGLAGKESRNKAEKESGHLPKNAEIPVQILLIPGSSGMGLPRFADRKLGWDSESGHYQVRESLQHEAVMPACGFLSVNGITWDPVPGGLLVPFPWEHRRNCLRSAGSIPVPDEQCLLLGARVLLAAHQLWVCLGCQMWMKTLPPSPVL